MTTMPDELMAKTRSKAGPAGFVLLVAVNVAEGHFQSGRVVCDSQSSRRSVLGAWVGGPRRSRPWGFSLLLPGSLRYFSP
jgi:hypothetical protein